MPSFRRGLHNGPGAFQMQQPLSALNPMNARRPSTASARESARAAGAFSPRSWVAGNSVAGSPRSGALGGGATPLLVDVATPSMANTPRSSRPGSAVAASRPGSVVAASRPGSAVSTRPDLSAAVGSTSPGHGRTLAVASPTAFASRPGSAGVRAPS